MPKSSSLHVVDLDSSSAEYQDVIAKFEQTMQKSTTVSGNGGQYTSITKIQRIQNLVLYAQYIAKKKDMDRSNKPGHQNEMRLFHGTSADTCPKINQQGFNRSFSGKNGKITLYTCYIFIWLVSVITHGV